MIRWGTTDPVYYGDILSVFKKIDNVTRTSFEAITINYTFKNGRLGLRDVTINEESGNLIALMGASGAGKSTPAARIEWHRETFQRKSIDQRHRYPS
ncbi:MAG: hypothetical protein WDO15_20795 [Bacteroidota bacterium]